MQIVALCRTKIARCLSGNCKHKKQLKSKTEEMESDDEEEDDGDEDGDEEMSD